MPARVGDRYLCFVVERPDRGWGGPYGQTRRPLVWRCVECGYEIPDHTDTFTGPRRRDSYAMARLAEHHECGHAPCGRCGKPLLKKKDGTPREHKWTDCKEKERPDRFVYVPERETRKEP